MKVREVFPVTDHIAVDYSVEKGCPQHGHNEKDEHEEDEDID